MATCHVFDLGAGAGFIHHSAGYTVRSRNAFQQHRRRLDLACMNGLVVRVQRCNDHRVRPRAGELMLGRYPNAATPVAKD